MKRDRDDTNFRAVIDSFSYKDPDCVFCTVPPDMVIAENHLAYAILDRYPVTASHALIIPKRHISDYFELGSSESNACQRLLETVRQKLKGQDRTIDGFNIGINAGEAAGQTIFHSHIHLIPRRPGDVANPRGGVRHTIPGKGYYDS